MRVVWGFLRKLPTCRFRFRGFKDKTTLHGCFKEWKTRNKLLRRCLEVKNLEATYESQISSLKCNNQSTRDVFRELNKPSKVRLLYLEVLKRERRCGWRFCKLTKRKKGTGFWRLKANKKGTRDVVTCSTALKKVWLMIHLEVKMSKEWYK